jgi:general secretion pathway protein G
MRPPSSLALAAGCRSQPAFGPSKPAQAGLEPRPSAPQGGRPPPDRQSRIRGGKLDRAAALRITVGTLGPLIEMVVTLAILAVLAAAARPVLELAALRQRETALRDGLRQIRGAIDRYEQAVAEGQVLRPPDSAVGRPVYPATLQTLVQGVPVGAEANAPVRHFLRRLPRDPFADASLPAAATWGLRSSVSPRDAPRPGADVFDVYSQSERQALDGTRYRDW